MESSNLLKLNETKLQEFSCPLCGRIASDPNLMTEHHLIPKCRGGTYKVPICVDCHRQIHALFSNKQLEGFDRIETLLADPAVAKFAKWVAKRPFKISKARRAKNSKKRGRSG